MATPSYNSVSWVQISQVETLASGGPAQVERVRRGPVTTTATELANHTLGSTISTASASYELSQIIVEEPQGVFGIIRLIYVQAGSSRGGSYNQNRTVKKSEDIRSIQLATTIGDSVKAEVTYRALVWTTNWKKNGPQSGGSGDRPSGTAGDLEIIDVRASDGSTTVTQDDLAVVPTPVHMRTHFEYDAETTAATETNELIFQN